MTDEPHDLSLLNADDLISDDLIDDWDAPGQPPALTIDWGLYEHYLEDSDLSDDDKRALIETLWSIMVSFVDLGFRLSPLQNVCEQEICGEVAPIDPAVQKMAADMVRSKDTHNAFENAAGSKVLSPPEKESAHE
jgi:hypothetical protein